MIDDLLDGIDSYFKPKEKIKTKAEEQEQPTPTTSFLKKLKPTNIIDIMTAGTLAITSLVVISGFLRVLLTFIG